MLTGLNKEQKQAVETIFGPVMVMAGAGSGKTRVLTHRIAHILQKTGISPFSILAVTFTNKAAKEMKDRVKKILDIETKSMWISTFHSFCSRLLRLEIENGLPKYTRNFVIIDEEDSTKIVKDIMKEEEIEDIKPKKIRNMISNCKNADNYVINDLYLKQIFMKVFTKYEQYLEDNNMLDFDDLIIKTIQLFKNNPSILEKYQYKFEFILVDEFQDTNDLQYKLIYMLAAKHHNVFVVGDDFQSIYSFRGAKIENINRFRKDYIEHKLILLEENYRSTNQILDLANIVIEHNPNQIKKHMFTNNPDGQMPYLYKANSGKSEAMYVVDKIKKHYLDNRKYSEIAVIYRTNAISRVFEDMLIRYQIPYTIYGGLSFFARKEIKDMVAYLRVIIHPEDDFSFSRIVNEPKRKIGTGILEKLSEHSIASNQSLFNSIPTFSSNTIGGKALKAFYDMICSIREQINNIPLKNIVDVILEETGYKAMLQIEDPEHERLENIYEFKNVLKETDDTVSGDNFDKLNSLLNDLSLRTDEEKTDDRDAVILSTYHQVKGLEFNTVFMVAMEEGIFPSQYHLEDLDIDEERRICYVGITRAKKHIYITYADSRMQYGRVESQVVSRFVKEMGNTYLKNVSADFSKKESSNYESYLAKKKEESKPKKIDYLETYKIGDKILHDYFGKGVVVKIEDEKFIKVAFSSPNGIKTLLKGHPSYKKM